MEVALYARVSKEEQAEEGASIDQQVADMRALCERNGWNVAEVFVDVPGAQEHPRGLLPHGDLAGPHAGCHRPGGHGRDFHRRQLRSKGKRQPGIDAAQAARLQDPVARVIMIELAHPLVRNRLIGQCRHLVALPVVGHDRQGLGDIAGIQVRGGHEVDYLAGRVQQ